MMITIAKKIVELLRNENMTIKKAKITLELAANILEQEPLTKKCDCTEQVCSH